MRLLNRSKDAQKSKSTLPLPTLAEISRRAPRATILPKKYARLGSIAVFILCAISVFYLFEWINAEVTEREPPRYESYHQYEAQLPQHDVALPYPEGENMKFFLANNHVVGEWCALLVMVGQGC